MKNDTYPHLTQAFTSAQVNFLGDYPYFYSPFAAVTGPIQPQVFTEISDFVSKTNTMHHADLVITFESSGNQLGAIVSQTLNIPCLIARKKKLDLPDRISFSVETNYDHKGFFIYGDVSNKNILLVDDVIASGSTMKQAVVALHKEGATVQAIFGAALKNNSVGRKYQNTFADIDIPIVGVLEIEIRENRVVTS